jgi:hypothetical protein
VATGLKKSHPTRFEVELLVRSADFAVEVGFSVKWVSMRPVGAIACSRFLTDIDSAR